MVYRILVFRRPMKNSLREKSRDGVEWIAPRASASHKRTRRRGSRMIRERSRDGGRMESTQGQCKPH